MIRRLSARLLTAAIAIGTLLVAPRAAQALQVEVLENGLTIIVAANHIAPVTSYRVYVRGGSMNEQEWMGMGLSHVLEHLVSGGTTLKRSEDESEKILDQLGGANNAYTTTNHICYYVETSSDKTATAIDLVSDWIMNAQIPEAEYKREMGVVMEELYKGKEEPGRILNMAFNETMFAVHPSRVPVIGYEDILAKITREDVWAYYKRMYVPNNIIAVAVGDFDEATVVAQMRETFKDFQRVPTAPIVLPSEPPQLGKRERTLYKDGLGGAYARIGFHTVPIAHEDLFPLDVLSYILSNGRSSRLVRTIREEQRLATSIGSYSHTPEYDAGVFGIAITAPDATLDAAIDATWAQLQQVIDTPVTEEELVKAKRQKVADEVMGKQTAEDLASDLASNYMTTGNIHFGAYYLDGIRKVTAEDVQRVARKYFTESNMTVVRLRPASAEHPEAGAAVVASTTDAAAADTDQPATLTVLPNGLRLIVKRNPGVPIVSVNTSFLGGVRLEPADHLGVSRLAGSMLTRGTTTRSGQEIATAFDTMGGSIGGYSGNNSLGLSMSVLASDFPEAMAIYADVLVNPSFPEGELKTVKLQTLDALRRRTDSWDAELSDAFRSAFFTTHPYGRDTLGTPESVEAMTPANLANFYKQYAIPTNGVMAVYGDIDPAAVTKLLTDAFATWTAPRKAIVDPTAKLPPEPVRTEDKTIRIVNKRQLAAVQIGYPGISLYDTQDRYAIEVLDGITSGIGYPGGWLHKALRGGDKDLVYMVHAYPFTGLEPGYFGITAASQPGKMDEVISIILATMERARTELVSDEELALAKTMCITMESLSRQTNGSVAMQSALDELYGLGMEDSKKHAAGIAAVTAEDVRRVAQKYLTHYLLVRTGPEASAPAADAPAPAE